jgi:hypothetical protein
MEPARGTFSDPLGGKAAVVRNTLSIRNSAQVSRLWMNSSRQNRFLSFFSANSKKYDASIPGMTFSPFQIAGSGRVIVEDR